VRGRSLAGGDDVPHANCHVEAVAEEQAATPVEAHAADRAWAPGGGGSKHARMQSKGEYTTVKNGAPQPMSRLNAPINAFCLRLLLILKDAPARARISMASEGGEQGRRCGGQHVPHMRPRRARWKRIARADDIHRVIEDLNADGGGTNEETARLGLACEGEGAGPSQARRVHTVVDT